MALQQQQQGKQWTHKSPDRAATTARIWPAELAISAAVGAVQNSTDISLIELNDKTNDERKGSTKAVAETEAGAEAEAKAKRKGKEDVNDGDGDGDDADNVVDKDKQCDNNSNSSSNKL